MCPDKKQLHAADVHNHTAGSKSDFNKLASTLILIILGGLFPGLKMRWRTKNYKYEVCTLLPMPLSKGSFQGKGNTIFLILRKIHVIAKKEITNPICTLAASVRCTLYNVGKCFSNCRRDLQLIFILFFIYNQN